MKRFLPLLILSACAVPLKPPPLPPRPVSDLPVVLSDRLSPQDFRTIFRSLNRSHKLDSLRPYLETPSDEALKSIARLASKYGYEDAFNEASLPSLLKKRIQSKSFSETQQFAGNLYGQEKVIVEVVAHEEFPKVLFKNIPLLNIDLKFPSLPVDPDQGSQDLFKYLVRPQTETQIAALIPKVEQHGLGESFFSYLRNVRPELGNQSLEAILNKGSEILESGALERLLHVLSRADSPSEGLFSTALTKFSNPELRQALLTPFEEWVPKAVAGFVREDFLAMVKKTGIPLKDFLQKVGDRKAGLSSAWIQSFVSVRQSIEKVTGLAKGLERRHTVGRSLSVYLNAYAITRWLESYPKPFTLDLGDAKEGLNDGVRKDLTKLGLESLSKHLDHLLREALLDPSYGFAPVDTEKFPESLTWAVVSCDRTQPFGDLEAAFGVLSEMFKGSSLETNSILETVNARLLTPLSFEEWKKIKRILLDDLGLAKLSSDTRKQVTSLFEEIPTLQKKALGLLEIFPIIHEIDEENAARSPVAHYLLFLKGVSLKNQQAIPPLIRFLSESKLFSKEYPALCFFVLSGGLKDLIPAIEELDEESRALLTTNAAKAFLGRDGLAKTVSFARERLAPTPKASQLLLRTLLTHGLPALSKEEKAWITRFVESRDFETLSLFLKSHGGKENLRDLVTRLKALTREGYLKEALNLLAQFKNERLQLVAQTALLWLESGEWEVFLDTLSPFLSIP